MRNPKPGDNIFPKKSLGIHIPDIWQWFNFNPLGEVIRANQQSSFIPCCLRECPYNTQSPLNKRPRAGQMSKDAPYLVNIWGKFLALVTLLHVLLCFPLHIWPSIALSEGPVWFPQISSCNSSKSSSSISRCMHRRYGPEKYLFYYFWSTNSQN